MGFWEIVGLVLEYFGNFNLELPYSPNLQDAVWYLKLSFKSSSVFQAVSTLQFFQKQTEIKKNI